jgi:hypothetical protein
MPSLDPALSLREYVELATAKVRERLPDVRAVRKGSTIVWTRGNRTATLDAAAPALWWLHTGRALTYCERPDQAHAHVAASNLLGHFDARWCRGIDHEPFSEAEMKRIEGSPRPLRFTP